MARTINAALNRFQGIRAPKRVRSAGEAWMSLSAFACFAVAAFLIAVPLGLAITGAVLLVAEWRLEE